MVSPGWNLPFTDCPWIARPNKWRMLTDGHMPLSFPFILIFIRLAESVQVLLDTSTSEMPSGRADVLISAG